MKAVEIKSVSDMLTILDKYRFQFGYKGYAFIFRGHEDASYPLIPGIYRCFRETQFAHFFNGKIEAGEPIYTSGNKKDLRNINEY